MERFYGVWALVPERCSYGDAPLPQSGVYTILPSDGALWFHVRWRGPDDEHHQTAFFGHFDEPLALEGDATLHTRLEDDALITEVRAGEEAVHTAWRRVDGDEMTVDQKLLGPDGPTETRAIYVRSDVKQVMVYRRDLKMRKGKIAAQCAHASMAVFFARDTGGLDRLEVALEGPMAAWVKGRFGKVVLSVETEEDLLKVHELALEHGIPTALITDSGRTEFNGVPTRTTVALGPAAVSEIDAITGPGGAVTTKLA